jgi:uncharacterized protein
VIAYLDASVVLRIALGRANSLREWRRVERGVASALVEVECLRILDRIRLLERLGDEALALRREAIFRLLEAVEIVEPTRSVLSRAAQPMPTVLGTLDAVHLASALLWQEASGTDLVMATHDAALGMAARASGLRVVGC